MSDGYKHMKKSPVIALIGNALDKVCIACIALFLVLTSVLSLAVTAYLPYYNYYVEYSFMTWPLVMITAVLFFVLIGTPYLQLKIERIPIDKLSKYLSIFILCIGCVWVAMASVWPEWDSKDVYEMARIAFTDETAPLGSYASRFTHQVPFALLIRGLQFIFGDGAYLAFEMLNVVSVMLVARYVTNLAAALFDNEQATKLSTILMFLFLPLIFYCTFMYANLIVLPLCLQSMLSQIKFFKRHQVKDALIAIVCVAIAILIKSSMVVFVAGMIVGWLINALHARSPKGAVLIVLTLVAYLASGMLTSYLAASAMKLDTKNALPKLAFIAMGLHENPEFPNNPGWYDGYLWSWSSEDYDINQISSDIRKDLSSSIARLTGDPGHAIGFFVRKYCSEWCMPDYESLLASNWSGASAGMPVMSERNISRVLYSIYYGKLNWVISRVLDWYQFILLLGALVSLAIKREEGIELFVPLLVAAGTALLYLFWEAQAQYIMHAYVLLVPYAGLGLLQVSERIRDRVQSYRTRAEG